MNLQALLSAYQNDPRLFQLTDRLSFARPQNIVLKNLRGSSPAFTISSVFQRDSSKQLNHVVICEDAESAAYLHNTIENLTKALNVFYFPSSFKNRKNFRLLNSSHVMLRTEALMKFSLSKGDRTGILITYPEALFEKVALPGSLSENIIFIKVGDTIDVNGLMDKFVGYGFDRTDFVYEPGQFALRGGILDIYSFGNEKPYRVELFGNDVDSIRIFDPESQLSERKLLQVSIIPNVETQFESEGKISLLDFLPENTIVWLQDEALTYERLLTQEEDLQIFLQLQAEGGFKPTEDDRLEKINISPQSFITAADFESGIEKRSTVHFGISPLPVSRGKVSGKENHAIEFQTKEQPAFNRQFDLLIKDLSAWENQPEMPGDAARVRSAGQLRQHVALAV